MNAAQRPMAKSGHLFNNLLNFSLFVTKPYRIPSEHLEYMARVACAYFFKSLILIAKYWHYMGKHTLDFKKINKNLLLWSEKERRAYAITITQGRVNDKYSKCYIVIGM